MAAWRVARSLDHLLEQLNAAAPDRSSVSDGSIGDAAHASRTSDHNPWVLDGGTGIVTARDFTHDPAGGMDCEALYQALVRSRDPRIKYVIWNRTITSGSDGPSPWVRRSYDGINAHTKHLHLSVRSDKASYDDTRDWVIPAIPEDDMPTPKELWDYPIPAADGHSYYARDILKFTNDFAVRAYNEARAARLAAEQAKALAEAAARSDGPLSEADVQRIADATAAEVAEDLAEGYDLQVSPKADGGA